MKLRTKVEILLAAVLLTFFAFNLMVPSAAVDLIKIGKKAGYEIISNVLAKADTASDQSTLVKS
ncbi:MAG: hypothetical protein JSV96_12045 [Candidatus Aminicenantes bacterium]|nr:MAG: hypothetical protein JSV96_12045 [Candidatus Aminicenantes bacterium]